jgi:hypothetical protein
VGGLLLITDRFSNAITLTRETIMTSCTDRKKVVTKLDSIALEAIEAGVTMFYWKDGKYRSMHIQI